MDENGNLEIGSIVLVRSDKSGVHMGRLVHINPGTGIVCLKESIRLWRWKTKTGVSLSSIAAHGIGPDSIVEPPVDIMISDFCEIIAVGKKQ